MATVFAALLLQLDSFAGLKIGHDATGSVQKRKAGDGSRGVPRIYLIDPTALAYLGEICALDDESALAG